MEKNWPGPQVFCDLWICFCKLSLLNKWLFTNFRICHQNQNCIEIFWDQNFLYYLKFIFTYTYTYIYIYICILYTFQERQPYSGRVFVLPSTTSFTIWFRMISIISNYIFWQFKICKISFVEIMLQWYQETFNDLTGLNI